MDQGRSFRSLLSQGSLTVIALDYSKFIRQHNKKSDDESASNIRLVYVIKLFNIDVALRGREKEITVLQ